MSLSQQLAVGSTPWSPVHDGHVVQFYETEEFLHALVADFIADGLASGDPVIVIATAAHREAFAAALAAQGYELDVLIDRGHLQLLDAREMLATFLEGVSPDPEKFRANIGGAIAIGARRGGRVRAYGEMVDVLWRDGLPDAAIRLEELWNDLATTHDYSLLCAYPIGNFYKHSHTKSFEEICQRHARVIPAESVLHAADPQSRAFEIARLQQQAVALQAELEHRKELEKALREALRARRRGEEESAFLLKASGALSRSLDFDTRVSELAHIIVPHLADGCTIDIVADGTIARAVTQGDAAGVDPLLVDEVVSSGAAHVAAALIVAPMTVAGRTTGAIAFVAAEPRYTSADAPLAIELARRAAVALDNARLHGLAQEANRAKDEFLATLSHELRTPLTAILGWSRMLRTHDIDAETAKMAIETIERSARIQAALIDDILDLSKLVTGKTAPRMEEVDLATVVDAAIETMRLAAAAKRLRVSFHRPAGAAMVLGDATRLQQITWNLLSNAIKFSNAEGEIDIDLGITGTDVRLTVRDNGAGIRPDFLSHVFEPFRQGESSPTRTHGGLGLGLAIVKSFAELHGGSVSAQSDGEGKGAAFTVTLPATG